MNASGLRVGATRRLAIIDKILERSYGTPERSLGNKDDPLDEAIYIILSFQTNVARAGMTWSNLRAAYPTWESVEQERTTRIAAAVREGGLQYQKARTIRHLLSEVRRLTGCLSLDLLRVMADCEAERFLTHLPGLSWKAARCILLYSLNREKFPVDSNTFRILVRNGVLSRRAIYRRKVLHDKLQAAVPATRRRILHVNLVVHGQQTCLPRIPQCSRCQLRDTCPKIGVPAKEVKARA
jgi:endonuclease-3